MEVAEAIQKRKSIRVFQKKEVPKGLILELIEAARLAPTARNTQPARFKLVRQGGTMERLRQEKAFVQDFVCNAPVVLVCYGNPVDYPGHSQPFWIWCDISIQTAFLVLRATELGLGTCYIGLLDRDKVKGILGIPTECEVPYAIILGYPAEEGGKRDRLPIEKLFEEMA